MALLAGIDEAGYGPILGPLVVTGVAFRVPDALRGECLWDLLRESCSQRPRRNETRLIVADSKQVYGRRDPAGLATLERTALAMLAAGRSAPNTVDALLDQTAPGCRSEFAAHPWYDAIQRCIPVTSCHDLAMKANALRRNLTQRGLSFVGAFAEPIPEGQFNRLVDVSGNKAELLAMANLRIMKRILGQLRPREPAVILADRLGGRQRYSEILKQACPEAKLHIHCETSDRSEYLLQTPASHNGHATPESPGRAAKGEDPLPPSSDVRITYATGADQLHFPVALAGMFSKYLRELFMMLFNEYWSRAGNLKPTAGYYVDAQRWLIEARPILKKMGIPTAELVRCR